jgi:hypothetical protein
MENGIAKKYWAKAQRGKQSFLSLQLKQEAIQLEIHEEMI